MKHRRGRRGFWWWSWILILSTIGLSVGGFFYGQKKWEDSPKDYLAGAVLAVDIREPFEAKGIEKIDTGLLNENERKILAEVESDKELLPIVEALNLSKQWDVSESDALIKLRSSLDLELVRELNELHILVKRQDPVEAAEIANAIARAIPAMIQSFDEAMIERESQKLQDEIKLFHQEIEDTRLALKSAFEANEIPIDPQPGLDVTPYNQIPAIVSANLAWIEAREFLSVAEKGQRDVERYLKRKIKPSRLKVPAVPPQVIAGPELKPFQVQNTLYGLTLGLLIGSLLMVIFWKLFP